MRLLALGEPGIGKGTTFERVGVHYNIPKLSTGALLREHTRLGTEYGKLWAEIEPTGGLFPDDKMNELVFQKLQEPEYQNGFILDGYPRTLEQAKELQKFLEEHDMPLDGIIYLKTKSEDEIMGRLAARRICPQGHIYNLKTDPPELEGLCSKHDPPLRLYQRNDDKIETIRKRFITFHELTEPIIKFYSSDPVFRIVDGDGSFEEVYQRTEATIETLVQ